MTTGNGADPVAAAVAAVDQAVPVEKRFAGPITLSTGRKAALNIPADITDAELVDLVAAITNGVRRQVRQVQAGPIARLVVPRR